MRIDFMKLRTPDRKISILDKPSAVQVENFENNQNNIFYFTSRRNNNNNNM